MGRQTSGARWGRDGAAIELAVDANALRQSTFALATLVNN